MANLDQIMKELEKLGTEQTRKTFARHGAPANLYGVKVGDLKTVAKKIKGDHQMAMALYETGNGDAQYLAGMVADGTKMSKSDLDKWAKNSSWQMVGEYTVPWVASENEHGRAMAMKWVKSKSESIAASGWNTYAGLLAIAPDEDLDLDEIKSLLKKIESDLEKSPERVKYCMNGFVIAVGTYVAPLLKQAKATAKKIGHVKVDMGDTSCKVPYAAEYIEKIEGMGRVGKKRKTIRC
jgi:3-methyladenine DNA glycosylase AlkD